jgi:MoaA/NifB/PqqE/SkfB family radical SAM enzyme
VFLPGKLVRSTVDELARAGFDGTIGFHVYNEPLCDPRLFLLIDYVRRNLPLARIRFSTNGLWLTQEMLDELILVGLTAIHVSCYSDLEAHRLVHLDYKQLDTQLDRERLLDSHLQIYEQPVVHDSRPVCSAPLGEIIIWRDGRVGLCCIDWKRQHIFGDLRKEELMEVLDRGEMFRTWQQLQIRNRSCLDLCSRCKRARGNVRPAEGTSR